MSMERIRRTATAAKGRIVGRAALAIGLGVGTILGAGACETEPKTVGAVPGVETCESVRPAAAATPEMPDEQEKILIRQEMGYLACRAGLNAAQEIVNPSGEVFDHYLDLGGDYSSLAEYSMNSTNAAGNTTYYSAQFEKTDDGKANLAEPVSVRISYSTGGAPTYLSRGTGEWRVSTNDTDNNPVYFPRSETATIYEWGAALDESKRYTEGSHGVIDAPTPVEPIPTASSY